MLQDIQNLMQNGRHAEALQMLAQTCAAQPGNVDLWLMRAALHAQLGDMNGIIAACQHVLSLQPAHGAARYNLALALQHQQRQQEAIQHYRALLDHEPTHSAALNNLGALLLDAGQAEQAVPILQQAIATTPNFAPAHNTLGLAYLRLNQHAQACTHFNEALQLDSQLQAARCNLARSLHLQGDTARALDELDAVLAAQPAAHEASLIKARILRESGQQEAARQLLHRLAQNAKLNAAAHFDLGVEFNALNLVEPALQHYEAAIALEPRHARALSNLGSLYHQQRRTQQGLALLIRAEQAAPERHEIQINLSMLHWALGHEQAALQHSLNALRLAPGRRDYLHRFAQVLGGCRQFSSTPELLAAMQACLADPGVDQQYLMPPGLALLLPEPRIQALYTANRHAAVSPWPEFLPLFEGAHGALFMRLLQNTVLANPIMETVLSAARQAALLAFTDTQGRLTRAAGREDIALLSALAHQCFNNEFAFFVSADESARLAQLRTQTAADHDSRLSLALLAALYAPLLGSAAEASAEQALNSCVDAGLRALYDKHFTHPRNEAALRADIPALTAIDDATSQAVRDQYEASPYPRWLSVNLQESQPYPAPLRDALPGFAPPDFGTREIQILIAGCGTGKHALQSATRFRGSQVTAVDLSRSSLAYGLRKTREYGIGNIDFHCGDILNLHALQKRFHIIESVGVLHHMRDPEAGLRSLRTLLAPSGLMNLGLYSSLARRAVYAAREHFQVGAGWSDLDAIRAARREILHSPDASPLHSLLNLQDFYSLSDCRDLLFHTQERSYRIAEIAALLERTGLRFLGFELPDPQAKQRYAQLFPDDPGATDLANWDRYEQQYPDTFVGMFVFWCQAA